MTKLLEKEFDEAAKLPDDEQDALAQAVPAELASERRFALALNLRLQRLETIQILPVLEETVGALRDGQRLLCQGAQREGHPDHSGRPTDTPCAPNASVHPDLPSGQERVHKPGRQRRYH